MWESSRLKKAGGGAGGSSGTGYPSFSTKNQGFFGRQMRRFSSSLPRFNSSPHYADKEKLGRGRWSVHNVPLLGRIRGIVARMGRKMKIRLLILLAMVLSIIIFYNSREWHPPPSVARRWAGSS
jgi:mannan polymerase II complex MNN10 subunit